MNDDKLKEECGVIGIFLNDPEQDAVPFLYYGLFSLQHRGQENAGIAAVAVCAKIPPQVYALV